MACVEMRGFGPRSIGVKFAERDLWIVFFPGRNGGPNHYLSHLHLRT